MKKRFAPVDTSPVPQAVPRTQSHDPQSPPFSGSRALASLPDPAVILDHSGRVIYANRAWEIFGRDHPDSPQAGPVGSSFIVACSSVSGQTSAGFRSLAEGLKALLGGGATADRWEVAWNTGGNTIWLEMRAGLVFDTERPVVILTQRDITALKSRLAELEVNEFRVRQALEGAGLGMWQRRLDHGEIEVTPRLQEILGFNPAAGEVTREAWAALIHPEDRPRVTTAWRRCAEEGLPYALEYRLSGVGPNASDRWMASWAQRFPGEPTDPGRIIGLTEDISERKQIEAALRQSEARLRLALQAANLGMWHYHVDTGLTESNPTYPLLFGLPAETPASARRDYFALIHPNDRPRVREVRDRALERLQLFEVDFRVVWPDGSLHWLHSIGQPIAGPSGKAESVLGVTSDLTQRKQAEIALRQAQVELKAYADQLERVVADRTAQLCQSNAELEAFAYSISHDLRAPLRAITGFAKAVMEDAGKELDPAANDYLNRIVHSASNMRQLIEDVLAFSRISRLDVTVLPVDIRRVILSIINDRPEFHPSRARLEIREPLPIVRGDVASLTQCFANLLGNAVKFVAPGQMPCVRVWGERPEGVPETKDGHSLVRICIEDNGIGIPEKYQHRLFGMFQRFNASYEGTGLGLAIVKKAVERMGGDVGFRSRAGQGSRFWLDLPSAG